jgi:GGDEF domain-containing protein
MIIPPQIDLSAFAINRQALIGALERCLRSTQNGTQADTQLTVLALIDLRQFNQVNQRLGYLAGDQVLAELQQRLASIPKQPLGCRRTDGDKVGLIISPLLNAQLIPLVAKKIIDEIARPLESCFFKSPVLEGLIKQTLKSQLSTNLRHTLSVISEALPPAQHHTIRALLCSQAQTLVKFLFHHKGNLIDIRFLGARNQILIAGLQIVHQRNI